MNSEATSRSAILSELCQAVISQSEYWLQHGIKIDDLLDTIGVPSDWNEISSLPGLTTDLVTQTVRLLKVPKRKKDKSERSPKKKRKAADSLLSEEKLAQFERQILIDYLSKHYVPEDHARRANQAVNHLNKFLETVFEGTAIRTSAQVVGSYASGLASKTNSMVDVLVRMDGGDLTDSSSPLQLAEAFLTAMDNCPYFASIKSGLSDEPTIECVIDYSLKLKVRVTSAADFDLHEIHHSRLFASLGRAAPSLPVLVCFVKQWALNAGLALFHGFHWTLLCSYFLIATGHAPNPRSDWGVGNTVHEVFGVLPNQYYQFMESRNDSDAMFKPLYVTHVVAFLIWLSSADLLHLALDTSGARVTDTPGWFNIHEPLTDKPMSLYKANHGDTIKFSLSIQDAARATLELLK